MYMFWLWNSSGERQEKVNAECPALKELLMVGLGYKDSRPHLLVSYNTWVLVLSRTVGNVVNFNINLPVLNDYARILEQNLFSPTCFVLVSDSVRIFHVMITKYLIWIIFRPELRMIYISTRRSAIPSPLLTITWSCDLRKFNMISFWERSAQKVRKRIQRSSKRKRRKWAKWDISKT